MTQYPRTFVPADLQVNEFQNVESLYNELLSRRLNSPADLERWLADLSELSSVVDEEGTRRNIARSCHTDDKQIEARFLHYVETIEPKVKPLFFALQKKYLESPNRSRLTDKRFTMLEQRWRPDVELFRDENIELEVQVTRTTNEYDKLCGAMMIEHDGKEYTLQQAARFLEQTDRTLRQSVWEEVTTRRLRDRAAMDSIFDRLLVLRKQIANNAGLDNYRDFIWKAYKRFDYTPDDCLRFADAIEEVSMPLLRKLDQQRRADLKLPALRPWDLSVDPKNRPPLKPFDEAQVDLFVDRTRDVIARLSPDLADDFESLRRNGDLDLASRKGKQPGGYQATLEEARRPFIFMNAAGLQRDVEVLLHEGGHAFHTLLARDEPLMFLRSAPMEFCEVASMSMELLGAEHFDVFYASPADAARARRTMLEGIIRFFPWMTTIDSFQHWIYKHPGHTQQERTSAWLALQKRFGREVDWTGYEAVREGMWQQQLHIFRYPFYYIEYGIAQLGALQLWMKSKEDPRAALANYRRALALGGTRPLPELFAAAGLQFDFTQKTLRPLMAAIEEELAELPA